MHFSPISPDEAILNTSDNIPNFVIGVINTMLRCGNRTITKSKIVADVLDANPRLSEKDQQDSWFDFAEAYSSAGWVIQHVESHYLFGECWVFRVR